jgi:hypothetical protein
VWWTKVYVILKLENNERHAIETKHYCRCETLWFKDKSVSVLHCFTVLINIMAHLFLARTATSKHGTLHDNRQSGVFSVPCWAAPHLLLCNIAINTSGQQRIITQEHVWHWRHATVAGGSRDMRLLFVGWCPTLVYIREVSSVPEEFRSSKWEGFCEDSWMQGTERIIKKMAYKTVTV